MHPNCLKQLLLRKEFGVPFDLEVVTKLKNKVAHLLISFTGRLEIEINQVVHDRYAGLFKILNTC
jgi:hypothetical protein